MQQFDVPPGATCPLCHAVLEGRILRDPHGQILCARHEHHLRLCRFCERAFLPAAPGEACPACARRAVVSEADAQARYRRVLAWFERQGLGLGRAAPDLRLSRHMPPDAGGRPMLGLTEKRGRDGPGGMRARRVMIQHGLPAELFLTVLVHELGHAWLALQPIALPEVLEEGICEWLAHHFALAYGGEAAWVARRIAQRDDPVYGAGFQAFRRHAGAAMPAGLPRLLRSVAA